MKRLNQIIFLFCFATPIFAQTFTAKSVDEIIGKFINSSTLEKENSDLYNLLEYYIENPVNLNKVTKSDLMKLPFLDINDADKIIKFRKKEGEIFSYIELKNAEIVSPDIVDLLTILTVLNERKRSPHASFYNNLGMQFRSRISYNIQESKGFSSGYYKSTPIKTYNRIKSQITPNIKLGFLVEKDAEDISYFNFSTFYFQMKNIFSKVNILAGFYTFEFGQGLAIWSPYSFSKGSDATNSIIKRARGVTPYTSAGEINYLKGAAIEYKGSLFSLVTFYSAESTELFDLSRGTSGVALSILPIGFFELSVLYLHQSILNEVEKRNNNYLSLSYKSSLSSLYLTGEFSIRENIVASLNTLELAIQKNFILIASIRNYPASYKSYYAHGFGETNTTNNEFGIYFGMKLKTELGIVNVYLDQFKRPSGMGNMILPSNGNEISLSYSFNPTINSNLYFRYFNERKEELEIFNDENIISEKRTQKLRGELMLSISKSIKLKTRIELLHLNGGLSSEKGILLFQDLRYMLDKKLTIQGRLIFFQTDSFNSRIYEFENDLIGVMTNIALWGKGIRAYLLVKYRPFKNFNLSLKYSEITKPLENYLGSGYNIIDGNFDNKIAFQIDFRF